MLFDMATDTQPITKQTHKGCAPQIRKLALSYPELSNSEIAAKVGCTTQNVDQVLSRFLGDNSEEDLRSFQANRADIVDAVSQRILESVTQDKIAKGSALQLVTAFGILHDKSQVLRGQATGINVSVLLDVAEAIRARQGVPMGAQRTTDAASE
jgi:predicted transcriptional regulator